MIHDFRTKLMSTSLGFRIKRIMQEIQNRSWHFRELQSHLPPITCIDVGASYFPHTAWWMFLGSPNVRWIAVDPNSKNLFYTSKWRWNCKIVPVFEALSEFGGTQRIYVTNVDSGSSMLKPVLTESTKHRLLKDGEKYFFPYVENFIDTRTLASLVQVSDLNPILVKLDTQGTELSIIRGALESMEHQQIIGIEIECSLYSEPFYLNSPRLWEVAIYLEKKGFEMLTIDVLPRTSKLKYRTRYVSNECDAVFALRRDILSTLPTEFRFAQLALYLSYSLNIEAISLLESDHELSEYLQNKSVNIEKLLDNLYRRSKLS
jgi:FkbM family methyltransferase